MKKFKFKLINLDGSMIEKEIEVLTCNTPLGEISILANHHPLITVVNKGFLKIKSEGREEEFQLITDALLEVTQNEAKIICFAY